MHQAFVARKKPVIYDPWQFRQFCQENGVNTIFDNLLDSMWDARHSEERTEKNMYVAMTVLYELCYGKSQR